MNNLLENICKFVQGIKPRQLSECNNANVKLRKLKLTSSAMRIKSLSVTFSADPFSSAMPSSLRYLHDETLWRRNMIKMEKILANFSLINSGISMHLGKENKYENKTFPKV